MKLYKRKPYHFYVISMLFLATFAWVTILQLDLHILNQIYYVISPQESISCYRVQGNSLMDIMDVEIRRGKSIFFHETSCNSHRNGKITITSRQACAVESAARSNPNLDVHLLFASPGLINMEGSQSDRFLQAIMSYKNVKLLHVDYERYTRGTPVQEIYSKRKVDYSDYAQSHASDILRYLTLSKYGGIYLDLDVVVVKSLEDLPPNFAGRESLKNVAAGAMGFGHYGAGQHHAKSCLEDLKKNFNGDDWGTNGPGVITRLLRKLCGVQNAVDMEGKHCQGFTVYPPQYFYAIPWWNWTMFFDEKHQAAVSALTQDSFVIHVWNNLSKKTKIPVGSKAPYAKFAREHCPKVYAECDSYF